MIYNVFNDLWYSISTYINNILSHYTDSLRSLSFLHIFAHVVYYALVAFGKYVIALYKLDGIIIIIHVLLSGSFVGISTMVDGFIPSTLD